MTTTGIDRAPLSTSYYSSTLYVQMTMLVRSSPNNDQYTSDTVILLQRYLNIVEISKRAR